MARIYQLRIYNLGYTTLEETINDEALISGRAVLELSGEETLTFQIDRDHADFADLAVGKVIELYHTIDAAVLKSFRIVSIIDLREEGIYKAEVTCESLKYDLNKSIFKFHGTIIEQTPLTHLTEIIGGFNWTIGTVTPTQRLTIQYSYDTVLSALEKVRQATGYDLEFIASPSSLGTINLKTVGNQSSTSTIEWQKNLKSLRRERVAPEVNYLYGIGGEGSKAVPMSIATHTHRITNISSGDHTLDTDKVVSTNGDWIGLYLENVATGNIHEITGSQKQVSGNDILTLATSDFSVGNRARLSLGISGVDFVLDQTSINSYGYRRGVFRDENFSDVINLLGPAASSAFTGTYTSDQCEGWSTVGLPTLAENTDPAFTMNGEKSQKVTVVAFTATPSSFDFSVGGTGELNGTYNYKFAWVTIDGEGPLSGALNVGTVTNQRVTLEMISSPLAWVTHWRIYRTKAGGSTYYFVADVLLANSFFTDTLADTNLTIVSPGNTAAGGQGIERTFVAEVDKEYSSLVWLFVESGRVRVELEAGNIIPEKQLGQKRATPTVASTTKFIVRTEGLIATSTSGKIRIVAHEGAAVFYVDSAGVFPTPYAPNSDRFVADNEATLLWYATFDELQRKKILAEKVTLSAVDLYETIEFEGQNQISIGDKISVIDSKLGVNSSVRVIKKSIDVLQPWNIDLEVNLSLDKFTRDYIERKKREQTISIATSRQASYASLTARNIIGSANSPTVEVQQID